MYDKTSPDFWKSVRPGSTVRLTDELSLKETILGEEFRVRQIKTIKEVNDLATWIMFDLENITSGIKGSDLWLVIKIVDHHLDILVYSLSDVVNGDRADAAEENPWIFNEHDLSDENCGWLDMNYSHSIRWSFDDDEGNPFEVEYLSKGGRDNEIVQFHGRIAYKPTMSGIDDHVATIVEYTSVTECHAPEVLILEVGCVDNDRGGIIDLYFGNAINTTEIEIMAN